MAGRFLLYSFLATLLGVIIGIIICVIRTPKGEKYNWEVALGSVGGFLCFWAIMGIGYFLITYFLT
ncbi:hypothetical protein COL77_29550 [Bacillus wiedmannii]|uniref:hypothetical protein n=1 Tax=Bacillus wiedmannii TaxID=1890302 RepID=UPI000BF6920D|nr:hypothetical protein [Bacillus wiedmannii]PFZ35516.1 hypothetical protein COL77_29550 [Bacillus wiedmannii]